MATAEKKRLAAGAADRTKPSVGKQVRGKVVRRLEQTAVSATQSAERSRHGDGVRELRQRIGVTQPEMARLLSISIRQVAALESPTPSGQSAPVRRRLVEMQRLFDALIAAIGFEREELKQWLHTPNDGFAGATPMQIIERGEMDRIWRMIQHVETGLPA